LVFVSVFILTTDIYVMTEWRVVHKAVAEMWNNFVRCQKL